MSAKGAPTDFCTRTEAACRGALEVCHPSLPLGPQVTAGELERLLELSVEGA